MPDNFTVIYSSTDNKEVNLSTSSSEQERDDKHIFADEENKSRLSRNSYGLLDMLKGWLFRNKKNIAIFSLILLIVVLAGTDLHRMNKNEYLNEEIQITLENVQTAVVAATVALPISNLSTMDENYFLVTCQKFCVDTNIMLTKESGDAKLHIKSDGPPNIAGLECSNCVSCKPRSSNGIEKCEKVNTWPTNKFYIAVVARTNYTGGKLMVSGYGVQKIAVYQPSFQVINVDMPSRDSGHVQYFNVTCRGNCTNVSLTAYSDKGDIDLFAEEDQVPHIDGTNCPSCALCKTRWSRIDTCENITIEEKYFYAAVVSQRNHTGASLRVKGTNLLNVTSASPPNYKNTTQLIPSGVKLSNQKYLVTCNGECQTIYVTLTTDSGDADLFGRHDKLPEIEDQNCANTKCTLCRSRHGKGIAESCTINLVNTDEFYKSQTKFFLTVHAFSDYTNGTLTIKGINLDEVVDLGTDQPPPPTPPPTTPSPNPIISDSSTSTIGSTANPTTSSNSTTSN